MVNGSVRVCGTPVRGCRIRNTNHRPCLIPISTDPTFLHPTSFRVHHPTSHNNTCTASANLMSEVPAESRGQTAEESHVQESRSQAAADRKCHICQQAFAKLEHLRRHIRRHTKERPFVCAVCGKSYARKLVPNLLLACTAVQRGCITTAP